MNVFAQEVLCCKVNLKIQIGYTVRQVLVMVCWLLTKPKIEFVAQLNHSSTPVEERKHWHLCAKLAALGSIPSCAAWIFPFLRPSASAFFLRPLYWNGLIDFVKFFGEQLFLAARCAHDKMAVLPGPVRRGLVRLVRTVRAWDRG